MKATLTKLGKKLFSLLVATAIILGTFGLSPTYADETNNRGFEEILEVTKDDVPDFYKFINEGKDKIDADWISSDVAKMIYHFTQFDGTDEYRVYGTYNGVNEGYYKIDKEFKTVEETRIKVADDKKSTEDQRILEEVSPTPEAPTTEVDPIEETPNTEVPPTSEEAGKPTNFAAGDFSEVTPAENIPAYYSEFAKVGTDQIQLYKYVNRLGSDEYRAFGMVGGSNKGFYKMNQYGELQSDAVIDLAVEYKTSAPFDFKGQAYTGTIPTDSTFTKNVALSGVLGFDVYTYTSNTDETLYRAFGEIANVDDAVGSIGWYEIDQNGKLIVPNNTGNHLLAKVTDINVEFVNLSNKGFKESATAPTTVPGFYQAPYVRDAQETILRRVRFYSYTDRNSTPRYRIFGTYNGVEGFYETDAYGNVSQTPVIVNLTDEFNNLRPLTQNPGGPLSQHPGEAFITSFVETDVVDGTPGGGLNSDGKWDPNNDPGNDSGPNNGIVRSFDTASYMVEVSTGVKTNSSFTSFSEAKVYFEVTISNPSEKVQFLKDNMAWIQDYKVTSSNGKQTLSGWYMLSSIGGVDAIPSSKSLDFQFKVMAALNGEKIEPEFNAWLETTEKGGDDSAIFNGKSLTISAAPKYNVTLSQVAPNWLSHKGYFDFDNNSINMSQNGTSQLGRLYGYGVNIQLYNNSESRQLKGIEIPQGDITYTFKIDYKKTDSSGTSDYLTPQLWDYKLSYNTASGKMGRPMRPTGKWQESMATLITPYVPPIAGQGTEQSIYNTAGDIELVQNGNLINVTVKDYKFDDSKFRFPIRNSGDENTTTRYGANVGTFSSATFQMVMPLPESVQSITSFDFNIAVQNSRYTSSSGQVVTNNQSPANKTANTKVTLTTPGGYSKTTWITKKGSTVHNANTTHTAYTNGDSWAARESGMMFWSAFSQSHGDFDATPVAYNMLTKFDDELLDLKITNSGLPDIVNQDTTNLNPSQYDIKVLYAAKKDKTGWVSDDELQNTHMEELKYFSSLDELNANGYINVGILYESRKPFNIVKGGNIIGQNFEVKETAEVGNVYMFITEVYVWTEKDNFDNSYSMLNGETAPSYTTFIKNGDQTLVYTKTRYNEDGTLGAGGHNGSVWSGNSLLIVASQARITKSVVQKQGTLVKTNYDLDINQRIADFALYPTIKFPGERNNNDTVYDNIKIVDTLPKGTKYISGSSSYGGNYIESTPQGYQGTVEGGLAFEPTATENADGTTTLVWKLENVIVGDPISPIYYSVRIGDVNDPINDVTSNESFVNKATIQADGDGRSVLPGNGNTTESKIAVTKLGGTSFSKNVEAPLYEIGEEVGYTLNFANQAASDLASVKLLDTLPYNGDGRGTNYAGTYYVDKITIDYSKAPVLPPVTLKYTNSTTIQDQTINASNVNSSGWSNATRTGSGKTYTYTVSGTDMKAFLIEGNLDAMTGIKITYHLKVNKNAPANIYGNSATVVSGIAQTLLTANTVQAKVARRTISGLAWIDSNRNGRQDAAEKKLSGVKVELRDGSGNLVTTDITGAAIPLTYTNSKGEYSFTNLPAGEYSVHFVEGGTSIKDYTVTEFQTPGVSTSINNDAVGNYTGDELKSATISDIELPELADMRNMDYKAENLDMGVHSEFYVEKTSTPDGGTESSPAELKEGDVVTYTVSVHSPKSAQNSVVVTDKLPVGMNFVPGSISYKLPGSATSKTLPDSRYNVAARTITWNDIVGTGVNIPVGTTTFTFKAVVGKLPVGSNELAVKNQAFAKITGEDYDYPSNEVYHKVVSRSASIAKQSALVVNGLPGSVNNGTEGNPIQAGLGQEIEYILIVKNTGATGTKSGAINVEDVVPAGTTFTGTQNVSFYDSNNVGTSLPGTTATQSFNSGSTTNLKWTLNNMSPNEEAHIKFRVKTDMTAITGTGDTTSYIKLIDNIASMTDVQKESLTYKETAWDANGKPTLVKNETVYKETEVNLESNETHHYIAEPAITIEKSSNPTTGQTVNGGDTITYTLVVTNIGKDNAKKIVVEDLIPAGTKYVADSMTSSIEGQTVKAYDATVGSEKVVYTLSDLAGDGTKATLTFKVTVDSFGEVGTNIIENQAKATLNDTKEETSNKVEHHQDLSYTIAKSSNPADGATVKGGQVIEYFITVINTGSETINGFEIEDVIPANTKIVAGSMTSNMTDTTMTEGATNLKWVVNGIKSGELNKAVVSFKVTVDALTTITPKDAPRLITNTAQYKLSNDVSTKDTNTITHKQDANFTIEKSADPASGSFVNGGEPLKYSVKITNTGSDDLQNLSIQDTVPTNTVYSAGTIGFTAKTGVTFTTDDTDPNLMKWSVSGLKSGESAYVEFTVIPDAYIGDDVREITNTAKAKLPTDAAWKDSNETVHKQKYGFTVNKSSNVTADYVDGGKIIEYTITVTNTATESINGFVLTDAIPANTTYITNSVTAGGTYNTDSKVITWNDTIPGKVNNNPETEDVVRTYSFKVRVNPLQSESERDIVNSAFYKTTGDPELKETNEIVHKQKASYTIVKSATPDTNETNPTLVDGSDATKNTITYTITITNTGQETLNGLIVKDLVPTNTEYVEDSIQPQDNPNINEMLVNDSPQWIVNGLAAGESIDVSFQVKIKALEVEDDRLIENTATAKLPDDTKEKESNTVTHEQKLSYEVHKTSDVTNNTVVDGDDIITYTITVTNTGHETLNGVIVNDPIPNHVEVLEATVSNTLSEQTVYDTHVQWVVNGVTVDEPVTLILKVKVKPMKDVGTETIVNTATYRLASDDPTDEKETETITHTQDAEYSIVKSSKVGDVEGNGVVNGGDVIEYRLTLTNDGQETLKDLSVTDDIPEFTTFKEILAIEGSGTVTSSKTGDTITWNVSDLAAGESVTLRFTVTVNNLNVNGTTSIKNMAHAQLPEQDVPKDSNETEHEQSMNYTVVKESNPDPQVDGEMVSGNDIITYSIVVTNNGSESIRNLEVLDNIPENTTFEGNITSTGDISVAGSHDTVNDRVKWTIEELEGGKSVTLKFDVRVNVLTYTGNRDIINTAQYKLPSDIEHKDTNTITHKQASEYSMVKSAEVISGSVDDTANIVDGNAVIEYTLTLTNDGHETLENLNVYDDIPEFTTFANEAGFPTNGGTFDSTAGDTGNGRVSWIVNGLEAGETITLKFRVIVDELNVPGVTEFTNSAVYHLPTDAPRDTNEITHTQDLAYEAHKTSDVAEGYVDGNQPITYTITVENKGHETLRDIVVTDKVPNNTTLKENSITSSHSATITQDTTSGTEIKWVIEAIPAGETATVTFTVNVNPMRDVTGDDDRVIENTAFVKLPEEVDETPTETIEHKQQAAYKVTKSASPVDGSSVNGGSVIRYQMVVENQGEETLRDLVVTDAIPTHTKYKVGTIDYLKQAGSPVTVAVDDTTSTLKWTIDGLKKGEKLTLSFDVIVDPLNNPESVTIENTAYSKLPDQDEEPTNTVEHHQNYGFEIKKYADPASPNAVGDIETVDGKQEITYTVEVNNTNTESIRDIVVEDVIPAFTKYKNGSIAITVTDGVSSSIDGTTSSVSGNNLRWTIAEIKPGHKALATFTVIVDVMPRLDVDGRSIENTASVKVGTQDPQETNTVVHKQQLDYAVEKSSNVTEGALVDNSDILEYTITIANNSTKETLRNFHVRDVVPSGTRYVDGSIAMDLNGTKTVNSAKTEMDWIIEEVPAGTSTTVSFKVEVLALEAQGENEITNTAYHNMEDLPEVPTNPVTHKQQAEYSIVKSSDPTSQAVTGGDEITYYLTVKNEGNETLQDLVVTDMIPEFTRYKSGSMTFTSGFDVTIDDSSETLKWTINDLAKNEVVVLEFVVIVDDLDTISERTISNVGQINLPKETPTDTNEVEHTQDLSYVLHKSSNPLPSMVDNGDTITYTIEVENTGNETLKNVLIKDEVPVGTTFVSGSMTGSHTVVEMNEGTELSWVISDIPAGDRGTVTFQVTVDPMETQGDKEIINIAYAKIPTAPDFEPSNEIKHTQQTSYTSVKSSDPVSTPTNIANVTGGQKIKYIITVENTGNETLQDLKIIDTIPEFTTYEVGSIGSTPGYDVTFDDSSTTKAWTINNLASGETVEVWFTVTVNDLELEGERSIKNAAITKLPGEPEVPGNEIEHKQELGYEIKKSSNPATTPETITMVNGGDTITYTIEVKNTKFETLKDVLVNDFIPEGTTYVSGSMTSTHSATTTESAVALEWVIAEIKANETAYVTFEVKVDPMRKVGDKAIKNTAEVKLPKEDEPTPTNEVEHKQQASYTINKSSDPVTHSLVTAGDIITYSITIENTGNDTLQDLEVTDSVPENTTYVDGSISFTPGFNVIADDSTTPFTWTINDLDKGEIVVVSFQVSVNELGSNTESSIKNTAYAGLPDEPKVPSPEVEHSQKVGYDITKSSLPVDGTRVNGGDTITYSIAIENTEFETLNNFIVQDNIPEHTTFVPGSMTSTHSAVTTEGETLEWVVSGIKTGETAIVTFDVIVDTLTYTGERVLENTAAGKLETEIDFVETNTVTHSQKAAYTTVKTSDPVSGSIVSANDIITYTISITNTEHESLRDFIVKDAVPAGTELVANSMTSSDIANTTMTENNNELRWTFSEITSGDTVSVTFRVKVIEKPGDVTISNVAYTHLPDEPEIPTNEVEHFMNTGYVISKESNPMSGSTVKEGDEITYTIRVKNTGTSRLQNMMVQDAIPEFTTYVQGSATSSDVNAKVDESGNTLNWTISEIAPGETATVSFKVIVNKLENRNAATIRNTAFAKLETEEAFRSTNEVTHNVASPTSPVLPSTGIGNDYSGLMIIGLGILVIALTKVLEKRKKKETNFAH